MNNSTLINTTAITPDEFQQWVNISYENRIALWVIDTLGSLLGTFGNLFVLVILIRNKHLHTKTNTLLMSLIASGLFLSLTLQPIRADQINPFFVVGLPLDVANAASIISYFACIFSIFCVTLERFIAVWKPLRYVTLVTSRRIKLILVMVWLPSIITGVSLYEGKYRLIFDRIAMVSFSFVITTSLVMYGYIFYIVYQQRKFIHRQSGTTRTYFKDDNSTTVSAIFVSIFIILWLPTLVYLYLLEIAQPETRYDIHVYTTGQYLISMHLWNGSINWYVYCWKCDKFRKALQRYRGNIPGHERTYTRCQDTVLKTIPTSKSQPNMSSNGGGVS